MNINSIFIFTVVRCDPPPSLKMGELDTTITLLGRSITYTCVYGFIFPDGATSKTITCAGDPPTWGPQSEIDSLNCTRKSFIYTNFICCKKIFRGKVLEGPDMSRAYNSSPH